MTIKINQNKFYHYNPLTEMTGSAVKRGNPNYGAIKGMKVHLTIIDRLKNDWTCKTHILEKSQICRSIAKTVLVLR